jgi:methanogenic corrinoid protein MtbC1
MGDFGSRADYAGEPMFSWRGASIDRKFQQRIAGARSLDTRKVNLAQTIESEIIPRLMMVHQPNRGLSFGPFETRRFDGPAAKPDIAEFAELITAHDASVATSYVAGLLDHGMSVETVYLDLLAPTARRLGEQWDLDLCDFTDVGLGLARLHQVMTLIGDTTLAKAPSRKARRRALLISMHDEMHNFGLFMVASFFRRANWDVFGWPLMTNEELVELVGDSPFHIVGISVSCSEHLDRARAAVGLIRKASRNKSVKIMIGGPQCAYDTVAAIGADATSSNGLQAVEVANHLVKAAASWS